MQDIDGLVLVAPAITAFSSDLRAQANGTERYTQHCLAVFRHEYVFVLEIPSALGIESCLSIQNIFLCCVMCFAAYLLSAFNAHAAQFVLCRVVLSCRCKYMPAELSCRAAG